MSNLRDTIAIAAMQELIRKLPLFDCRGEHGVAVTDEQLDAIYAGTARSAYCYADAMLDCRAEVGTEPVKVMLNGQPAQLPRVATYKDLILAAGHKPHRVLSVTYSHAAGDRSGILAPGQDVALANGARISVADTSNA